MGKMAGMVEAQPLSLWSGIAGQTDYKMMCGLIERCWLDENPQAFRASVREMAEAARVTGKTAGKSLKRLCQHGLIAKVLDKNGQPLCAENSRAHLYRFCHDKLAGGTVPPDYTTVVQTGFTEVINVVTAGVTSDLVETKSLNVWGTLLYTAMRGQNRSFSGKELASIMGFSERQIRALLPLLAWAGLVERVKRGQWRSLDLTDEEVAVLPVSVVGRSAWEQRHLQILQERAAWLVNQMIGYGLTQLNRGLAERFREVVSTKRQWLWEADYISDTLYWTLDREEQAESESLAEHFLSLVSAPARVEVMPAPPPRLQRMELPLPTPVEATHPVGWVERAVPAVVDDPPPTWYCQVCGQQPLLLDPLPASCAHCVAAYGLKEAWWVTYPRRHKLPPRPKKGEDMLVWLAIHVLGGCFKDGLEGSP